MGADAAVTRGDNASSASKACDTASRLALIDIFNLMVAVRNNFNRDEIAQPNAL